MLINVLDRLRTPGYLLNPVLVEHFMKILDNVSYSTLFVPGPMGQEPPRRKIK
jgi:hypothetical protein